MLFEDIARNWASASLLMRALLDAQETPYVHVLQPNQYHTTRSFTPEERAIALDATSGFKAGVEQGYPALVAEAAARGLGARTGSSTGPMSSTPNRRLVYGDNCCHYTRVGYLRLADFIARAVLMVPGPWHGATTR